MFVALKTSHRVEEVWRIEVWMLDLKKEGSFTLCWRLASFVIKQVSLDVFPPPPPPPVFDALHSSSQ